MNKEIISASSLRCSARMRIREEWSRLKETDDLNTSDKSINKNQTNVDMSEKQNVNIPCIKNIIPVRNTRKLINNKPQTSDVLRGVVALVEVGSESRALALRAALTALGSSVVPKWSPLVTHLVWSQGGDRTIRAKARALACRLVSPLWVEACAASANRLPEQSFPAAPRPSDLPSPRALKQMLKKADMENLPLSGLTSSKEEKEIQELRLRISSETERNTSSDASTTRDTTLEKDKSHDTTDVESRVNTAPRRVLPMSLSTSPQPPKHSRRKLFTHKEADVSKTTDEESEAEERHKKPPLRPRVRLTQKDRRDLVRAERMARRMVAACNNPGPPAPPAHADNAPRIVLTGVNRTERQSVTAAVRSLGGRIQTSVNKRTTHVLLGSCKENINPDITGVTAQSGVDTSFRGTTSEVQKARTLNALLGAARGCRVLHLQWALHSAAQGKWLHHLGYEVEHLKKISQKARIERIALGQQRANYSYDVFGGTKVLITDDAQQKEAAIQLLTICGAVVIDGGRYQHGGHQNEVTKGNGAKSQIGAKTQKKDGSEDHDGRNKSGDFDVKIGVAPGEVSSKWVFDSVASARMRTTRRYVN